MSLFQVTKKQVIENYELRTMTGDIVSFTPSYSQLLPDPFSDLNVTVNVLATGGNGTPDSPIPINGFTEANITRCSVNLLHVNSRIDATTAQVHYTSDDNYLYLNGTKSGGGYADLTALTVTLPAGTYYLKAFVISGTASNTVELYAYDGSTNLTGSLLSGEKTITLTKTTTFRFRFAIWKDGTICTNYKIGIVISTASISEYSEYNGNTCTIAFGQTVYGGQLIILPDRTYFHVNTFGFVADNSLVVSREGASGGVTVFKIVFANNNFPSGIDSTCISSHFSRSIPSGTSGRLSQTASEIWGAINTSLLPTDDSAGVKAWVATNAVTFYYEITPFDIDLTPKVISAVVGTNNVFADCGETTVTCLI